MKGKFMFIVKYLNTLVTWKYKEGYVRGFEDAEKGLPQRYSCEPKTIVLEHKVTILPGVMEAILQYLKEQPEGAMAEPMMYELNIKRNAFYNAMKKLLEEDKITKSEGRPKIFKIKLDKS